MDSLKLYKVLLCFLVLLYSNINLAATIDFFSTENIFPMKQDSMVIEPEPDESIIIEPVILEPVTDPAIAEPVVTKPVAEPVIAEPVVTKPIGEPAIAEPVATEPVIEAVIAEPAAEPEVIEAQDDEPEVVHKECERIANKLSSLKLAECQKLALTISGAFSNQQAPLLIKEYPPLGDRQPQARILMLGGIHGDEYSSVTIMFRWMQTLDKYHSGLFHWKVTPLVNPDGLLQKASQRMNANGVDLNRNFDNGINETASLDYWEKRAYQDPRRYPGETPMSEPETRWIKQLIDEFEPDAIVAVHAPYGIVDFDGPHKPPSQLGSLYLNLLGTYPGSLGNYAGLQLNIPVVTVELPHAGIMPSDKEVSKIWVDLVGWLRKNIPKQETSKVAAK